jgi:uncharacterized repeat protein (TIGR01451 family)
MLRKAFFPAMILASGVTIAAIVHAQESGGIHSQNRPTLVDQLARIRDELAGRSTPGVAPAAPHNHAHENQASPTADWSATRKILGVGQPAHNHDDHQYSHAEPLHDHSEHDHAEHNHPAPPTGAVQNVAPQVYENPYALSGEFQPATQARPSRPLVVGQNIVTTPSVRPPQQSTPVEDKPTLQQRLARLINGDEPEPRSAVASGPGSSVAAPAAAPAHNHDAEHSHDHAAANNSATPVPTPALIQLTPSPTGPLVATPEIAAGEATPSRLLTPEDVIPSLGPTVAKNDEFLQVEKSPQLTTSVSGPKSMNIGQAATYVVVLQNVGAVSAGVVNVTLELPPWAEVSRAVPTSGGVQAAPAGGVAGSLVWRIPAVVAQSRERLELDVVPRDSRPLELAVHVSQAPTTTTTVVDVREPKVQIVIAGPDELQFGETKIYQLTVSNPGDGVAENVNIDLLPLTGQSGKVDSNTLGVLKPGDSKTIDIKLTARQAGTLSIKAQATAKGGLTSNIEKAVLVRRAGLRLDVAAPEAQYAATPVKYLVHVSNPGNATARGVKVSATLPQGAEFQQANIGGQVDAAGDVVTWTIDSLSAQDAKVLELVCVLNQPGANRLQVVSDAQTELSDAATASTDVIAVADLKLEVSDPQGPVAVGDEAIYQVVVRNRGTEVAPAVQVATFFSEGVEPIEASGGMHQLGPGQVVFQTIDRLEPGEERVLQIKARADREGNHSFRTELVCHPLDTRLIAEETTRFYGGRLSAGGQATDVAPHTARLEPIPTDVQK